MKKGLALAFLFFALAGCRQSPFAFKPEDRIVVAKEENVDFTIGMAVGSTSALDDDTFNAIAWQGVVQYVNRYPKTKVQRCSPHGESKEDLKKVVEELLVIKPDILLGLEEDFAKIFATVCNDYPDVNFVILSSGGLENNNKNVVTIDFAEQQTAFLAGIAAALNSETKKVGYIGGQPNTSIERQLWGYEAGIGYANQNFGTDVQCVEPVFADSWEDPPQGRKLAKKMYADGVDVIYTCAAVTGKGVMYEAQVLREQGKPVWLIGVDSDLYNNGKGLDGKSVILTSAMKKLDVVIYEIFEDHARGRFPGGQYFLRYINDDGIGLPDVNKNFDEKTKTLVGETEAMIKDGSLVIPFDMGELKAFAKSFQN